MSNDMRDWLGFAFTTVSLFLSLYGLLRSESSRDWQRRRVRRRSFKGWGVEWTAYDERDDRQS